MALICGFAIDRFEAKLIPSMIGMILGTIVCYLFGTGWLAYQAGMTFYQALAAGVLPFIVGDLVQPNVNLFFFVLLNSKLVNVVINLICDFALKLDANKEIFPLSN